MPCITFPIDPSLGPVVEIGISAPASLATPGAAPALIHWVKAIADTGCSRTSIHSSVATLAGLTVLAKIPMQSATHTVPGNLWLADIFIKFTGGAAKRVFEFPFRDRRVAELKMKHPQFDALLGMDFFNLGMMSVNGKTGETTFCW